MEMKLRGLRPALLLWIMLLSAAAGFLNLSTISIYDVCTSHYTGNLSKLAAGLYYGEQGESLLLAGLVLFFLLGGVVSGLLFPDRLFRLRRRYGLLLMGIGLGQLLVLRFFTDSRSCLWFISFALGIQNAMFISYRGAAVRTSHFTGYLSDAGFEIGRCLRGRREQSRKILFWLLNIASFVAGGILALTLYHRVGSGVLYAAGGGYLLLGLYFLLFRRLSKRDA